MIEEGGVAVSLYEVEARRIIKIIRKDKSLPEQNSISGSENIARKGHRNASVCLQYLHWRQQS